MFENLYPVRRRAWPWWDLLIGLAMGAGAAALYALVDWLSALA